MKGLTPRQVPIEWEEVSVTPVLKAGKTVIPDAAINSVKKNTVALKGALIITRRGPILNVILRTIGNTECGPFLPFSHVC